MLKYLIHGHLQNEGDNVHSVIEKMSVGILNQALYLFSGAVHHIDHICKKLACHIQSMTYHTMTFTILKTLPEQLGKNFNINTERSKFHWHDIKVLRVEK